MSHELLTRHNTLTEASVVQVNGFKEQERTTLGGDDADASREVGASSDWE